MTPTARAVGLLAAVALGAVPAGARAQPASDAASATLATPPDPAVALTPWLDRDAPMVLRLEAGELARLVTLARSIGAEATGAAALATLGGMRYLGFDPLSRKGWLGAGLDPEAPALLQLAAIDSTATDRVYRDLSRSGGQWGTHRSDSPVLWRSRLVVRALDPSRASAALLSGALIDRATPVDAAHGVELASLLGATSARGLVRDLLALDVTGVAAMPLVGALVFLRRRADIVAVDVVAPFAGDALEWRRDRAALRAVLDRRSRAHGLPPSGAAAIASPGLVLWTHPLGLHHMSQAWRATEALRRRIGGGSLPDVVQGCGRLRSLERAALTFAALTLRLDARKLELTLRYGHDGSLATALDTADQRVLDGVRATDLVGRVHLASLAGLRALTRPSLLGRGWDDTWQIADWCGAGAAPLIVGFAWPELGGLWLDELAAALPEAQPVLAGIGNLGIAIDEASSARVGLVAVVEAALSPPAAVLAARVLDQVFGQSRSTARPVPHRRWGKGPLHPYLLSGETPRIGAGFGRSARWRVGMAPRAPTAVALHPTRPPLVAGRGRMDHLVSALTTDSRWARFGKATAAWLGAFSITSTSSAAAIDIHLVIETR